METGSAIWRATFTSKRRSNYPWNYTNPHNDAPSQLTTKQFSGSLYRWKHCWMSLPCGVSVILWSFQNNQCKPLSRCCSCPSSTCCVFVFWKYGLLTEWGSEREEIREVVGLSRFVAYIPNKECWKPVRDQSYSPKGLTARCPRNTFKASNSPPDQMQPGNNEKHWPLRLEPVSVLSHSQAVAGGIFLKDKRWNAAKKCARCDHFLFFWGGGNAPSVSRAKRLLYLAFMSTGSRTVILTTRIYHFGGQQGCFGSRTCGEGQRCWGNTSKAFFFPFKLRTGFVSKETSGWWHLVQPCLSYALFYGTKLGSGIFSHIK